jgi:putative nucleotidyltransferase with HDIG domain
VHKAVTQHALTAFSRLKEQALRDEVRRATLQLRDVTLGALASLVNALEARSPHFQGHSQHVASCAESIAVALRLSPEEIESVRTAGLLHDVGMIGVPDAVINSPGDLTLEQRAAIEDHCHQGATILEPLLHLGPAIRSVLEHHERMDGSGYPGHLRGDAISAGGQIVGLAEVWTAMTEARSFRDRMTPSDAMATLAGASGRWFDQELVNALFSVVTAQGNRNSA